VAPVGRADGDCAARASSIAAREANLFVCNFLAFGGGSRFGSGTVSDDSGSHTWSDTTAGGAAGTDAGGAAGADAVGADAVGANAAAAAGDVGVGCGFGTPLLSRSRVATPLLTSLELTAVEARRSW
jgi:hypothetical protein